MLKQELRQAIRERKRQHTGDELAELSPSSVVATVDMSQSQVVEGTESLSVSISVPSSNTIFAVGSYSVECSITVDSGS